MPSRQQITRIIGAHGLWKSWLLQTIHSGKVDKKISDVRKDNCCEFGQWLYGENLSEDDKNTDFYHDIKELHARFHMIAGDIVSLVAEGQREKAEDLLEGDYHTTSVALTQKLLGWLAVAA